MLRRHFDLCDRETAQLVPFFRPSVPTVYVKAHIFQLAICGLPRELVGALVFTGMDAGLLLGYPRSSLESWGSVGEWKDTRVGTVLEHSEDGAHILPLLSVLPLSHAQNSAFRWLLKNPLHHDAEHASASITGEWDTSTTISAQVDRCSGPGLTSRSGLHGLEGVVVVASMGLVLVAVGCSAVLVPVASQLAGQDVGSAVAGPGVEPWMVGQDDGPLVENVVCAQRSDSNVVRDVCRLDPDVVRDSCPLGPFVAWDSSRLDPDVVRDACRLALFVRRDFMKSVSRLDPKTVRDAVRLDPFVVRDVPPVSSGLVRHDTTFDTNLLVASSMSGSFNS